jgi:hypothetical protein
MTSPARIGQLKFWRAPCLIQTPELRDSRTKVDVPPFMTMTTTETLELLTITEAARRIGACGATLKRRIAKANITPDAILIEGSNQLRSPLFVATRLPQLTKLIYPETE